MAATASAGLRRPRPRRPTSSGVPPRAADHGGQPAGHGLQQGVGARVVAAARHVDVAPAQHPGQGHAALGRQVADVDESRGRVAHEQHLETRKVQGPIQVGVHVEALVGVGRPACGHQPYPALRSRGLFRRPLRRGVEQLRVRRVADGPPAPGRAHAQGQVALAAVALWKTVASPAVVQWWMSPSTGAVAPAVGRDGAVQAVQQGQAGPGGLEASTSPAMFSCRQRGVGLAGVSA
jgi:hypothetical protein